MKVITRAKSNKIASALTSVAGEFPARFAIRGSGQREGFGAIAENIECEKAFTCPEQTGKRKSCGSCGLCPVFPHPVRFLGHAKSLAPDHRAIVNAESLFQGALTALDPREETVLKDGNSKLGKRASHRLWGDWQGAKIKALTLEERKTCPRTCNHWSDCYGNNLYQSKRFAHGPALQKAIERDIISIVGVPHNPDAPRLVIRLHVLGDFYSVPYVEFWRSILRRYPTIMVFGYTAHPINLDRRQP